MGLSLYQVDAFCEQIFGGNPAAVCPLEHWLDRSTLQAIAMENNLSETAFFVGSKGAFELRWFTPQAEVDLCGHATLAAAHVILSRIEPELDQVRFTTNSGPLSVRRAGDRLELDFPSHPPVEMAPHTLQAALGTGLVSAWRSQHYDMAVLASERELLELKPDMGRLAALEPIGVIATAPPNDPGEVDFVSRFFAPRVGVPEDPATGSAHCVLAPFWGRVLGKRELRARQLSRRVGHFVCELEGERVKIAGRALLYSAGTIEAEL